MRTNSENIKRNMFRNDQASTSGEVGWRHDPGIVPVFPAGFRGSDGAVVSPALLHSPVM